LFYTYTFSAPIAAAVIFLLANAVNPLLLSVIAAFGSLLSDYLIFKFVRSYLLEEIKLAAEELKIPTEFLAKFVRKKWVAYFIPVVAGIIIASPLPDEIGVALLAASRYNRKYFAIFSYLSNFVGIVTISMLGATV
jgi:uncharacterized membrane protein YdjX (TVP38/TMEM64 family)